MIAIGITTTPNLRAADPCPDPERQGRGLCRGRARHGNPRWRIALFHILPNIMPALLVQATLSIAAAIIAEAAYRSSASGSNRRRHPGAAC